MHRFLRIAVSCILLLLGAVMVHAEYSIKYNLTATGHVSINIYNSQGQVVRELLRADPETAGNHTAVWDGLDRSGNVVPDPTACTWKLLQTPGGLTATYLMSLGTSYTPDATQWFGMGPGCHGAPGGVAVDKSGMYVAANTTENIETAVLKQTTDGVKRLWSVQTPVPWDGAIALASAGGNLYMLGHMYFTDGRIQQYGLNAGFYWNPQTVWIYNTESGKRPATPRSGNCPGGIDVRWDPKDESQKQNIDATDMDASSSAVIVAYASKNAIRWYDPSNGTVTGTGTLPAPQGVAVAADGTVYASTGSKIVKIVGDVVSDLITGLTTPTVLSVDNSNNTLLVYQAGSKQVLRYRIADGALLNTYGKPGGRATGLYDAAAKTSFFALNDLTTDGAGGFYITEQNAAPRRVAHFGSAGNLLNEWYGGTMWAPCVMVDPDDPTIVWLLENASDPSITRLTVNYAKKTWRVHSVYNYYSQPNRWFGLPDPARLELFKHRGKTFITPCIGAPRILRLDEKNWRLLPVTICDSVAAAPADVRGWAGNNQSYQWNDWNGDGAIQQNEATFYANPMAGGNCGPHVDKNGEFYQLAAGSPTSDGAMVRRAVTWKGDIPTYEMPGVTKLFTTPLRMRGKYDPRWSLDAYHDTVTGDLYCGMNVNITDWCTCSDAFLGKWTGGTTEAWEVGGRADGSTDHFRRFVGRTHGCSVLLNTAEEFGNKARLNRSYVWDSDGLWVGGLMDTIDKSVPAFMYGGGAEWLNGTLYTDPKTGAVYVYTTWTNEVRVYKITGWDNWKRQGGKIMDTVTAP